VVATALRLKFDPNQDYQVEAVQSVLRVFEGLPRRAVEFGLAGEIVPNLPAHESLDETWLFENVLAVQQENGIRPEQLVPRLEMDEGMVLEGAGDESWRYPNFTIEMETGTGKTNVYLRTIYELRKQYGFSKFIIVVPSLAIFEGVLKTFDITRDHFRALYDNEPMGLTRYDGSQLSRLRSFASSTLAEVMVITLDAFNKASNNLYKASEKLPGERKPYEYIQETRPIVILDEPQNMESERSKEALRTLHPFFALRYSATHRTSPNLLFRLTPFEAYRRGLVKKIQVHGVTERDSANRPLLVLRDITMQGGIAATVRTLVNERGTAREATIMLRQGDDLYDMTGRDEYRNGYRVAEIHAGQYTVEFENGVILDGAGGVGASKELIFRHQIGATIEQHMRLHERLRDRGIKVLSLFFIDAVANYVAEDGIIRTLFDAAFDRVKVQYPSFAHLRPEEVRSAYFAKRKLPSGEEQAVDISADSAKDRDAAREAFQLIMRDKERLLSFGEPVSFIFAHSALKEGWDNPNVFQICTLNEAVSEIRKRQEIGRGLRLCVNQEGDRVTDDEVNVLTVVANEGYRAYADALQSEYVADGEMAPPAPSNARRHEVVRNDRIFLGDRDFRAFWEQLTQRLRYQIHVDTKELVERCAERLNAQQFPKPMVVVEKGEFTSIRYTMQLVSVHHGKAMVELKREARGQAPEELVKIVELGMKLAKAFHDERLRRFVVLEVIEAGDQSRLVFDEGEVELDLHAPYVFESMMGQDPREQVAIEPDSTFPVFNLLDRGARETGLTRPTINRIFKELHPDHKEMLLRNPEGFAGVFISVIRNTLADHVAARLEFTIGDETTQVDLEELFPAHKRFPQRELIEAGERGIYDQVQIDSDVEVHFVQRLRADDKVLFYFKFPPAFKVRLPHIIGNYNPDWGIARYDETGRLVLHLVRETKGSADLTKRQFPHERRKIVCAQGHFRALGVDYRHVTGETTDWWRPAHEVAVQQRLGDD
jgi:type III restriction enzyme